MVDSHALPTPIGTSSCIVQRPNQVAASIDGVTAIMGVEHGAYYLMDAVGSDIWARIERPRRVSDVCDELVAEYDVDASTCETQVLEFVAELRERGLIEIQDRLVP
jgi:hypothetical protein